MATIFSRDRQIEGICPSQSSNELARTDWMEMINEGIELIISVVTQSMKKPEEKKRERKSFFRKKTVRR